MDVRLFRFKDDGAKRSFHIKRGKCVIGRDAACDLQIPTPSVSRHHCEVVIDGDNLIVRDLNSSNGVFLNEARVKGETHAAPGDRLAVGPIIFTIQIDGRPKHVEPPLLDAPTAATAPEADDSAADIADLIARATSALTNEDSSVLDFDLDLDDD
ncbi:MAG: FHA domain-containing protein [Phycisphaeraceae bacterium]|nr:FHA domain-containing protein [Phycisphaeraceae bacterium]